MRERERERGGQSSYITVCGRYRTGKSFLVNRMLLDVVGKGFMVGATVNSCTKGLWIWNKPLKCKMQDGTEVSTRLGKLHLDHM